MSTHGSAPSQPRELQQGSGRRGCPRRGVLLVAAILCGCDGVTSTGGVDVGRRDSAGISIVESMDSTWREDRWQVDAPTLVVGGGGVIFERVVGVERLADGSVAVLDAGSGLLRWFDPAGGLRAEVGGVGEGPDEFRSAAALVILGGDTVAVWDVGAGAIVGWADGERIFRHDVPRTGSGSPRTPLVYGGGYLLPFREGIGSRRVEEPGRYRISAPVLYWGPGAATADTLAMVLSDEFMTMQIGGRSAMGVPPFIVPTDFAVAGESWFTADAAPRFDSDGRPWAQIERRDREGGIEAIIRLPPARGAVTQEDREGYLEAVQAQTSLPPAMVAQLVEALIFPDFHPAFGGVKTDPDGHLWLHAGRVAPPLPRDGPWRVLDPDGRWLGSVAMPDGFELMSVGRDHVAGVRRDPLGVEEVWVLPIVR